MKAKNLLLASAVLTAFAACSQDEFLNDVQKVNDGRPVVGTIVLDIPESAQTRWGWGSSTGFTFDENDYIGAALMDAVNELDAGTWEGKYSIEDYISTNYKYGYKDGWTNNDAVMSEGNYFFYMPYNENLKSRAGLKYEIPTDQFAYDETAESPVADATRAWKKNQLFIGYDSITVNHTSAVPNLVEAFAKPRFNVNYIGSNGVQVERVVLRDANGRFNVKGQLTPSEEVGAAYNPIAGGTAVAYYNVANTATLATAFAKYNEAIAKYTLKSGQSYVSPLLVATSAFGKFEKSDDISLNFVPSAKVTGLMVVPAGTHTVTNIAFDVYTNKGMVSFTAAGDKLETAADGKELTYKNISKLTNITPGMGKKEDAVVINFGDKDIYVPNEVTISTTAQLESIMRWYVSSETEQTLAVNISGDKVELTQKVYDIIKGNSKLTVVFKGTLTIADDVASDAVMTIAPTSTGTVVVKNEQTLAYTANKALTYDIKVEAEGTLNITTGSKTTTVGNIENNGTLNVKGKVKGTKVTNNKDLNVNSGASLEITVENKAAVDGDEQYTQVAVVTNNGTLTLLNGSYNESKIVNNAEIMVKAGATFDNNMVEAEEDGTNGYTAVIENLDANKSYIRSNGTLTNYGKIYNKGAVYSQNAGQITNANYIMAYSGATTYITNNVLGYIELEKRNTETQVNGANKGCVYYDMKESDLTNGAFAFDKTNDKFNTLYVSMDVTFANGDVAPENIVLYGKNLTVNCKTQKNTTEVPVAKGVAEFESITAMGGYRYIVQGVKVQTKSLYVGKKAVFQVPALSIFGVFPDAAPANTSEASAIVANAGEILVGGAFFAKFNSFVPAGTLSSAGTGSYNWNAASFDAAGATAVLTETGIAAGSEENPTPNVYAVRSNVTIAALAKASTLLGTGVVTVAGAVNNTPFTSLGENAVKIASNGVKIVLGSLASPWSASGAVAEVPTQFSAVKDVKIGAYYTNSNATYYVEWTKGESTWTKTTTDYAILRSADGLQNAIEYTVSGDDPIAVSTWTAAAKLVGAGVVKIPKSVYSANNSQSILIKSGNVKVVLGGESDAMQESAPTQASDFGKITANADAAGAKVEYFYGSSSVTSVVLTWDGTEWTGFPQ